MNKIFKSLLLISGLFITYCGDPGVDIANETFEHKIVVEGYLYVEEPVDSIKLMRNYKLNSSIDLDEIYLTPEKNSVIAKLNGVELNYNEYTKVYSNHNIVPEYNKPYTLEVSAVIDGKQLHTNSTTITPQKGFEVVNEHLGTLKYRQDKPVLEFKTSPGTDFYAFSIVPQNANLDNFIYDNPYFTDISREDLEDNFNGYYYQIGVMINVNSYSDEIVKYEVPELDTWFYTDYKVELYAGDKNFKDYVLTVNNVQEPDGNFIEPAFNFENNGIGVFGSAIRSKVYFSLVK